MKAKGGAKMESVDLIASGYEWHCPKCENFNREIEWKEHLRCSVCGTKFEANYPEHAWE